MTDFETIPEIPEDVDGVRDRFMLSELPYRPLRKLAFEEVPADLSNEGFLQWLERPTAAIAVLLEKHGDNQNRHLISNSAENFYASIEPLDPNDMWPGIGSERYTKCIAISSTHTTPVESLSYAYKIEIPIFDDFSLDREEELFIDRAGQAMSLSSQQLVQLAMVEFADALQMALKRRHVAESLGREVVERFTRHG